MGISWQTLSSAIEAPPVGGLVELDGLERVTFQREEA
jgi:hypothetical protein